MKRVAVVGSGISGIAAADELSTWAEVTLFEAATRLGGHTDTHEVVIDGELARIDSGFIVFNERNYPQFSRWLDRLGVSSQATDMSLSVRREVDGFEYGTDSLGAVLAQPTNLMRPRFWRMWRDLLAFYRRARGEPAHGGESLLEYSRRHGYRREFVDDHLVPMCAALWSQSRCNVLEADMAHVLAFMANHVMLDISGRPTWRVVRGGSTRYVERFVEQFRGAIRKSTAVEHVETGANSARVRVKGAWQTFDAVVLACHSDQALVLIDSPTPAQRCLLQSIRYQSNRVQVHTDDGVMPRSRRAWSSWNAVIRDQDTPSFVTYWSNRLQRIRTPRPVFVSLNAADRVRDDAVVAEREYAHPVFDRAAVDAQSRLPALQGQGCLYFAGAYSGWGFHEDGFRSGIAAAEALRVHSGARRAA